MAKAEGNGGKNNENTLEDDEGNLLTDEAAVISILQLSDTVCATSKNEGDGRREAEEESVEAPAKGLGSA